MKTKESNWRKRTEELIDLAKRVIYIWNMKPNRPRMTRVSAQTDRASPNAAVPLERAQHAERYRLAFYDS